MKRLLFIALVVLLFLCCVAVYGFEGGDTGTYRILDYRVALTPHTDGSATIDYYQKWMVTDGYIPWITVGVPNDYYSITSFGMNANQADANNNEDESLVRITLDRNYQPKETFQVKFTIEETRLFADKRSVYRLDFTPGWYDRAQVDHMMVWVKTFADSSNIKTKPEPSYKTADCIVWKKDGLDNGDRYKISVSIPKKSFASAIPEGNLRRTDYNRGIFKILKYIGLIIMVIMGLVIRYYQYERYGYSGGYFGGGYGGGGCACACAGCACACACAGGGGAGCSRKKQHACRACSKEAKVE